MTVAEYLTFPNGKMVHPEENRIFKQRSKLAYDTEYPTKFSYKLYIDENFGHLIIHVKVPSRRKKGLNYDVVICLRPFGEEERNKQASDINFTAFSNCPSFYYRFAKAFASSGMFVQFLSAKYDELIMAKDPDKTNPMKKIGYERTLYHALLFLQEKRVLSSRLRELYGRAKTVDINVLKSKVQTQGTIEEKMANNKDTKEEKARKKDIERRKKAKLERKKREIQQATARSSKTQKTVYSSKTTRTSNSSRTKKT